MLYAYYLQLCGTEWRAFFMEFLLMNMSYMMTYWPFWENLDG